MRSPITKVAVLAAILAGAAPAYAQDAPGQQAPPVLTTPDFVTAAAQSDEFEAAEGRLAQSASTDPEVRAFGAKMIHDHGATTSQLQAALARAGMPVPPPVPLTAEQDAMLAKLQPLRGRAFDAEYARQAVLSHQLALGLHEEYNLKGDNPAIKQASMLATPVIKEHLRIAENLLLRMRAAPPQL